MKYYIIAGEASGDLHGSNLIKEIKKLDAGAVIRGWGGDKMETAGATLAKHYRDLAFMGFAEVVKNLPAIMKNFTFCKEDIKRFQPDAVVLINYSTFNLKMAKWTHTQEYKNIFYISPQVWAWKESRVNTIKKYIDKMIVILPFEKQFFKDRDYDVEYVGHPLVDVIESFKKEHSTIKQSSNIIALLPGSRRQEIKSQLPVMLEASKNFPNYNIILAKAPSVDDAFYEPFLSGYKNVEVIANDTYSLLMEATAALVTSGTATLETALFGVPEIVCYKAGRVSYEIALRLVKLKYICLVNLIMDKEVVKELIQDQLTPERITIELKSILFDHEIRTKLKKEFLELKELLSEGGNASYNAAKIIYNFIKIK
ncbi:MAG: lipid-A-disaccharide synthase [Bacteroidota bacterium]|nr:lipid-A-disaccharide synthase [Bacteroidota bacterium]